MKRVLALDDDQIHRLRPVTRTSNSYAGFNEGGITNKRQNASEHFLGLATQPKIKAYAVGPVRPVGDPETGGLDYHEWILKNQSAR